MPAEGEEYDLINAVRKNPTNENVKKFLELYKNEIGKYEQSIVDEVNTELAALETGSGVEENVDEAKINIEREEKRNKKIKTINKEIKEIEKEINELEELQNEAADTENRASKTIKELLYETCFKSYFSIFFIFSILKLQFSLSINSSL